MGIKNFLIKITPGPILRWLIRKELYTPPIIDFAAQKPVDILEPKTREFPKTWRTVDEMLKAEHSKAKFGIEVSREEKSREPDIDELVSNTIDFYALTDEGVKNKLLKKVENPATKLTSQSAEKTLKMWEKAMLSQTEKDVSKPRHLSTPEKVAKKPSDTSALSLCFSLFYSCKNDESHGLPKGLATPIATHMSHSYGRRFH